MNKSSLEKLSVKSFTTDTSKRVVGGLWAHTETDCDLPITHPWICDTNADCL